MTLETASVGTIGSHVSSLNSIDEDEEEKEEVEKEEEEEESPPPKAKGKREKLTEPPLKPAASSKAKDGEGEEALKAKVHAHCCAPHAPDPANSIMYSLTSPVSER